MVFEADDIQATLEGLGSVDILFGKITTKALSFEADEELVREADLPVSMVGTLIAFTYETSKLPGFVSGSKFEAETVTYTVRARRKSGDGLTTALCLED